MDISMGKLRWLCSFSASATETLATKLEAKYDSKVLPEYNGNIYSNATLAKIFADVKNKGKEIAPRLLSLPTNLNQYVLIWAIYTQDATALLHAGFIESQGVEYARYPFNVGPLGDATWYRSKYWNGKRVVPMIRLALLDTAKVRLRDVARHLKGYPMPDRYRLESRPDFGIDWPTLRKFFVPCEEQWKEYVLPHLTLESKEYYAALIAIEKCQGKTHKEACEAVLSTRYADPVIAITKRREAVKALAKKFDVDMPPWRT